ncbi:MAG: manganese efflux pump MntP family protein [Thermodesulfobacteriota bacterium]|nr:manganese efflux pump MntP family protein [Thermodesulfobacteriota bacterium]
MGFLSIILIAIGLGMDAFAVAIGTGVAIRKLSFGHVFRLSFHFGFFQFLMPVVGWLAGRTVSGYIAEYDHWIAFGLLLLIGCKMISDSFKRVEVKRGDPTRGLTLIILSVATSIDALAVGLGLAFLNTGILYPSIVIGIVAFVMTIIGMVFARVLGKLLGRKVEILGGIILIGIGIKILIEHLLG